MVDPTTDQLLPPESPLIDLECSSTNWAGGERPEYCSFTALGACEVHDIIDADLDTSDLTSGERLIIDTTQATALELCNGIRGATEVLQINMHQKLTAVDHKISHLLAQVGNAILDLSDDLGTRWDAETGKPTGLYKLIDEVIGKPWDELSGAPTGLYDVASREHNTTREYLGSYIDWQASQQMYEINRHMEDIEGAITANQGEFVNSLNNMAEDIVDSLYGAGVGSWANETIQNLEIDWTPLLAGLEDLEKAPQYAVDYWVKMIMAVATKMGLVGEIEEKIGVSLGALEDSEGRHKGGEWQKDQVDCKEI